MDLPKSNLAERRSRTRLERLNPSDGLTFRLTLHEEFKNYLKDSRVSQKTIENYLSDLTHFSGWAILHLQKESYRVSEVSDLPPYFNFDLLLLYKEFLVANKTSLGTANRRLSTLRSFGRFISQRGLIPNNPAENLPNIRDFEVSNKTLLEQFRTHLVEEGVSNKTVKNYVSDIQGFLKFVQKARDNLASG